MEYLVRASYLEIYNEEIRDLLSHNPTSKLDIKESTDKGVYVKDLTHVVVKSQQECNSVLKVRLHTHTHTHTHTFLGVASYAHTVLVYPHEADVSRYTHTRADVQFTICG